jgi:hypothetical protein
VRVLTVKLIVVWITPIGKDDLKAYAIWGLSCGKVKFRENVSRLSSPTVSALCF